MVNCRRCFVPGCKSGYDKETRENKQLGIRNRSLFKAKTEAQRDKWNRAIAREDRVFAASDVVCELHFRPEEISRYFETKMPDGSIHRMSRERPKLSCDAVPSLFPKYRSRRVKTRKPPSARGPISGNAQEEMDEAGQMQEEDVHNKDDDIQGYFETLLPFGVVHRDPGVSAVVPEPFDFQVLMKEALNIVLPSDLWTVGILKGNQVIFANWSDGEIFEAKKRVLIDEQLQVKIFFGSVNTTLKNMKEVHSLAEAEAFLIVINQLNICQSTRSPECFGYTIPGNMSKKETIDGICCNCQKAEKESLIPGSEKGVVGQVEMQNKIFRRPLNKSCEVRDHFHNKKRGKVRPEKGDAQSKKPSPGALEMSICGEAIAVDNSETETAEEVDFEELAPPPEWRSLATPQRLLSPPREDVIRPTLSLSGVTTRGKKGTSSVDIKTLVRDVHRIPLPSDSWTLGVVKAKRLIFASWKVGKVLEAEKRLVVDEDLSVKVIFGSMILSINEITKVTKFEDITRYLYIVDNMSVCKGIGTGRRAASCPGYYIRGQMRRLGYCPIRCAYCQGATEELRRIRRMNRGVEQVRAEAQGKVWKNLKKLSDLYPGMKRGIKASTQ